MIGHAVDGGAGDLRRRGAAGDADEQATRLCVPVRRAQASEGGHEQHAAAVRHTVGELLRFLRAVHQAEAVAQPLHRGPGDEHAAFQGVMQGLIGAELPGDGGQQALLRAHRLRAGVLQCEATGAVGVFRHAGLQAGLTEQRGLLVAGHAGDGNVQTAQTCHGQRAAVGHDGGQHGAGHAQQRQQLVVPVAGVEIAQQGAAGIADIGEVGRAAAQVPYQPAVDGACGQLATFSAGAGAGNVIEQPSQLGGREIGVGQQAGALLQQRRVAVSRELGADARSAPVLPNDGVRQRPAGGALPQHHGFALVGDANGGEIAQLRSGTGQGFGEGGALRGPDVERVMFHPAGLRVVLGELALRAGQHPALQIDDEGARAGRTLIERGNQ